MGIRAFVCASTGLLFAPLTASAAFVLTVPEISLDLSNPKPTQVNVDIFFSEVDPGVRLAGFAVRFDITGGGTSVHLPAQRPNAIALTPSSQDAHPYVFLQAGEDEVGVPAPARPAIPANDEAYGPTTITVAALADVGREPEIGLGQGVLRVPLIIEPNPTFGVIALTLDPLVTSFADPDGLPIPVTLDNGFINGPEPSSFALLALSAAALGVARPRRAVAKR